MSETDKSEPKSLKTLKTTLNFAKSGYKSSQKIFRFFLNASVRCYVSLAEGRIRYQETQKKNRKEYREHLVKRQAEEEERQRNKIYFDFWRHRGKVYGIKRNQYKDGNYLYPTTEFFWLYQVEKN